MNKKRGFTLAEIIISVGIIAVIAAVMLPMVNKFKPDKEKVLYLKVHDAISEAIGDMASNPNVFPTEQDDSYFVNSPLFNTDAHGGYAGGNGKICRILAETLGAANNTCADAYSEFNGTFSFVMPNGVQMYVSTNRAVNSETVGTLRTDIVFDVNGEKGRNCFADECAKPDRFRLIVGSQGQIIPADEVGEYYLTHRANWKLKGNYELAGFPEFTVADATVSITQKPQDPPPVIDEIPGGNDNGGDDDDDDIPEQTWSPPGANFKVKSDGTVAGLRRTALPDVYCEIYNGSIAGGEFPGHYYNQRHYIWNQDTEQFLECPGVYHTNYIEDDPTYKAYMNGDFQGHTNGVIEYQGKKYTIEI